jgi:valyl-tRNA synthetase
MVMLGLRFTGEIPFADVYIHSVIQAPDGRRMSKSLGTGVDPLALIDGGPRPAAFAQGGDFPAYGADAVRFGLLAMSSSQDVRFSEEKIAQGQALVNKLFNATRFALLQIGDEDIAPEPRVGGDGLVEDRWILSRLDAAKDTMRTRIDDFDFAKAALGLYDYIYGDLCDWYLEMVKPRLYAEDDPAGRADLAATLRHVLRETLMLAHPIIPFVTEELWGMLGEDGLLAGTLAPAAGGSSRDPEAEEQVGRAIAAVTALRGWRDRCEVRPGAVVPIRLPDAGYEATGATIAGLARVELAGNGTEPVAGIAVPGGTIGVLPSPDVDLGAAERRLEARRAELRGEIERAERKLANDGFVAKAPPQVVDAERDKLARFRAELEEL